METDALIPIWQNKPHGSTRSVVRRIGSTLPLRPCPRACFQALPGLPPLRPTDGPLVPTLADIAWIAADEEETYARVRSDTRPLRHEWRPTPLLVLHRNASVPNFRREGKKVEGLKKPGVTALNRTTALQEELSRLRAQIAKIVASEFGSSPLTPDLLSPDDTSMTFSMTPFEAVPYQPTAASFVISDVCEEEEEEDEDDAVAEVSELVPDPIPPVSMTASATFDLERPTTDFREVEEDTVSLSKSTSFADVTDILKDMTRMKMSKDRYNRGCTSLRDEDSASLISEALRKKSSIQLCLPHPHPSPFPACSCGTRLHGNPTRFLLPLSSTPSNHFTAHGDRDGLQDEIRALSQQMFESLTVHASGPLVSPRLCLVEMAGLGDCRLQFGPLMSAGVFPAFSVWRRVCVEGVACRHRS
ncbi:mitochondrial fission regulator 1-like [Arapaima gigas]